MKKLLIIPASLLIFTACGDKPKPVADSSQSATVNEQKIVATNDSNPANKTEKTAPANKLSMADLVGTWEQTQTQRNGADLVSATITVQLMKSGDFIATATTTSNMGTQKSPEQKGKWTLYANTVSLSGVRNLIYEEKSKLLVDDINKVALARK
ncbi:MAG: hypothetical protein SGJ10_11205 [Bacteroidota bacterium]|nr:hypothetical protein [Bacteroidota bacterium]